MGDQFAFVYKLLGGLVIAFIVVFVIAMWGMDLFRKVLDEIKGDDEFDPDKPHYIQSYVNGAHRTDAISKCRVLGFLFEHMPKNEYVKLENIL